MSFKDLLTPFPWTRYSKKLKEKILKPKNSGFFTEENAKERSVRYVEGKSGSVEDGNAVCFYWFVDPEDGVIVDAKFQVYGQSALIGAAEAACEFCVGKNYLQAKRISADLLDKQLRDHPAEPAFPKETYGHLNLVIEALEEACSQCEDIPIPETYLAPPVPYDMRQAATGGYPGWEGLSTPERRGILEEILDRDIRPYIALDGGGVDIKEIKTPYEVIITYQGNCTSCFSSVGTTLSYIQQVLRSQVHPNLTVTPDL